MLKFILYSTFKRVQHLAYLITAHPNNYWLLQMREKDRRKRKKRKEERRKKGRKEGGMEGGREEGGSSSRFYYYLDMVRPTDQTTDTENRICYSRIPGGGGAMPPHREP